jgi:hypothetical protein
MALILVDGFDHYTSTDAAEKFWQGHIFGMVPGRGFGGQAMNVIINNAVSKTLPSSYSTVIVGAAYKLNATGDSKLMGLNTTQVTLHITGTGFLYVRDSLGNIVATGTTIVPTGTWFYVEVKAVKGSSGTVEVHLNGGPEIASTVGNFGTSNFDQIIFYNDTLGGDTSVDDVVVMDGSGSAPTNDFLGDVRVETLYPVADGSHVDWTPKTGTDHYAMVNEHLIDGDGSFVYDANPGDKDSYIIETFIGTIYGAQLNIGARKGDSALRQIAPLIRQGGTDYVGTTRTLSADYVFYSWLLDNDPTGSPWLAATINADEFGQELIA